VSARRGELWLVDFGEPVGREQAGTRPAVVVSADALNEGSSGVLMVVPVTSIRRGLPSHVEIDSPDSGLDEVSYAKCEDLKSISDRRLVHRVGTLDPTAMASVERVLRYLLDL
jgi:mRNA interferase MazF